jgi:hexosaminidase
MLARMSFPALVPRPRSIRLLYGRVSFPEGVRLVREPSLPPQHYALRIDASEITLTTADDAGAFYGRQTLAQLRTLYQNEIPAMEIHDGPDFPVRGLMLDVSRDKVPTMATLKQIIDQMAGLKLNQLQLYTEHAFAYAGHEDVWKDASPITPAEIRELDAYCRERFIDLVPNQNSFGHLERWLAVDRYKPLAEAPNGFDLPWGGQHKSPFSLNPTDPRSLQLVDDWYTQLLPHFTSTLLNVGCDETFDLGAPGSRNEALCRERGKHRVYLDYVRQIHALCRKHGRRMMFWGDIIIESPELVAELPKDAVALEWGYEADHPFDQHLEQFKAAGLDFYVCPGTSSWLSLAGRTDNAVANLRNAAIAGVKHGAAGYLITDWGDWGHWQPWLISLPPLAYGAAVSWCQSTNADHDPAAIDAHVFQDDANTLTTLLFDLGNLYKRLPAVKNSSLAFRILQEPARQSPSVLDRVTIADLKEAESEINAIHGRMRRVALRPQGGQSVVERYQLAADEVFQVCELVKHALRRGRWRLGDPEISPANLARSMGDLIARHHRLWHARNRPGGFRESVGRLHERLAEYQRGVGVSPT